MVFDEVFCLSFKDFSGEEQFKLESPVPSQFVDWLKRQANISDGISIPLEGFETGKNILDIIKLQKNYRLEITLSVQTEDKYDSVVLGPYTVYVHTNVINAPQSLLYEEIDSKTIRLKGYVAKVM